MNEQSSVFSETDEDEVKEEDENDVEEEDEEEKY